MRFTGERYLPEIGGEIRLEHVHRYAFCADYVREKRILDAACGEGYGSAVLAQWASHVVGLDVSAEAVSHAGQSYAHLKNLEFVCGDATALEFGDNSFDVVVSFETLEHLHEQEKLMAGFARVLRPNGLLILSSPDKYVYSDLPKYSNEFHVRELYRHELEALVRRHFKRHRILGQRLAGGSAIFVPAGDPIAKTRRASVLVDEGTQVSERPAQLQEGVYLIVMASNGTSLPAVAPSVLLSETEDPLLELKRIARWASGVHDELMAAKAAEESTRLRLEAEVAAERERGTALAEQLAQFASAQDAKAAAGAVVEAALASQGSALLASQEQQIAVLNELTLARDALAAERHSADQQLTILSTLQLELTQARRDLSEATANHQQQRDAFSQQLRDLASNHRQELETLQGELAASLDQAQARQNELALQLKQARKDLDACERLLERERTELLTRLADSQARAATAERGLTTLQAALAKAELAADDARLSADAEKRAAQIREDRDAGLIATLGAQAAQAQTQWSLEAAAHEASRLKANQLLKEQADAAQRNLDVAVQRAHAARDAESATERALAELRTKELEAQLRLLGEELAATHTRLLEDRRSALAIQAQQAQELAAARVRLQQQQLAMSRHEHQCRTGIAQAQDQARQQIQAHLLACTGPSEAIAGIVHALDQAIVDAFVLLDQGQAARGYAQILETHVTKYQTLRSQAQLALDRLAAIPGLSPPHIEQSIKGRSDASVPGSISQLLRLPAGDFVAAAYKAVLGREADTEGLMHYLERVEQGEQRLKILADLRLSPEGARREPAIKSLDHALAVFRRSRIPLMGRAARQRIQAWVGSEGPLPASLPVQAPSRSDSAELLQRFDRIDNAVQGLAEGSALLAEAVPLAVALSHAPPALVLDAWTCAKEVVRLEGDVFVKMIYALVLQREPTDDEMHFEVRKLREGASRSLLVEQLIRGSECQGRFGHQHLAARDTLPAYASALPSNLGALAFSGLPKLPVPSQPSITVVLVAEQHIGASLRSLRVLAAHTSTHVFEVLAVTTSEQVAASLASVQGLRVVFDHGLRTLAEACNSASRLARGGWLCFLLEGSEPCAGWLDELRRTFDIFAGTGMAVSAVAATAAEPLYGPSGASALPKPNCAFTTVAPRGPSLMVQRLLFDACGGFDASRSPMIDRATEFDDSDGLAARLANRGYRSVVQATAQVVRPQDVPPSRGTPDQASFVGHVLLVEQHLPLPDHDAGSLCITNVLLMLREIGLRVSLAVESDERADPEALALFRRSGIEVQLNRTPRDLGLHLETEASRYTAFILCRPDVMSRWHATLRASKADAPILYYPHDLHFLRLSREAAHRPGTDLAERAEAMRQLEAMLIGRATLTLVVSQAEQQLLSDELPDARVAWLPIAQDVLLEPSRPDRRRGLLFVGSFDHAPNVDAVEYLLDDLFPRLRQRLPGVTLTIVGEPPRPDWLSRNDEGLHFAGHVPDLSPWLEQALVMLAPLRFGAGAKGKVIRAMCSGLPVVASSVAAEGLGIQVGKDILVGDEPDTFVEAVIALCTDSALWRRTAEAARRHALSEWSAGPSTERLRTALAEAGVPTLPASFPPRLFREDLFLPVSPPSRTAAPHPPLAPAALA